MEEAREGGEGGGGRRGTYLGDRRRAVARTGRRRRDGTTSGDCSDEIASASARRGRGAGAYGSGASPHSRERGGSASASAIEWRSMPCALGGRDGTLR